MVTNLHERKFKTTKNSSVNQKTKLRGNLHVDFQREGQLKFFDVVGSFFLAHWIFYWHWKKILVSNFSQVTIFTQIVHVYDPRHLEWASLSESLSSRLFSGVIQPQHFGFFQTSGSFWSTGRDPFSTLGDYVWHQTKPYTFFFHVPHRWFRNEEMRSAAEGRLKEYNKPPMRTKWEGKQTLFLILGYK